MAKRSKKREGTARYLIQCAQSSMGTSPIWYQLTRSGKQSDVGVYGGPPCPFSPDYREVIEVTFRSVKKGKAYPVNPFKMYRTSRRHVGSKVTRR